MNNLAEFAQRRQHLMAKMGKNTIAIIAAAPECLRNADSDYLYRQNSDFYYLTGFCEPEAILVLLPGRAEGETIMFNRVRDLAQETWHGRRAGQEGVVNHYGVDAAYPIAEFSNQLPDLLLGREKICYAIGRQEELDRQLIGALNQLRSRVRMGIIVPSEFVNLEQWLHRQRQIKSDHEIQLLRKAAEISAQAHIRAMQACKAGLYEYSLVAELQYEFTRNGSAAPAYNYIVGSGENSCILHYNENNALLKEGDLVLIDAGCEYQYYAADITRTFPVNGRFSVEQRAIYEIVLAAQLASIAEARPGSTLEKVHMASVRVLVAGLVQLGILQGNVDELIEQKAYFPFYMHRTGHWLGLDVHDAGSYKIDGEWCVLEPGMVHTIEPGIYIAANTPGVEKKWWNIGVRIEDDVLITKQGCEILSVAAPKTVAEIEALMAQR